VAGGRHGVPRDVATECSGLSSGRLNAHSFGPLFPPTVRVLHRERRRIAGHGWIQEPAASAQRLRRSRARRCGAKSTKRESPQHEARSPTSKFDTHSRAGIDWSSSTRRVGVREHKAATPTRNYEQLLLSLRDRPEPGVQRDADHKQVPVHRDENFSRQVNRKEGSSSKGGTSLPDLQQTYIPTRNSGSRPHASDVVKKGEQRTQEPTRKDYLEICDVSSKNVCWNCERDNLSSIPCVDQGDRGEKARKNRPSS